MGVLLLLQDFISRCFGESLHCNMFPIITTDIVKDIPIDLDFKYFSQIMTALMPKNDRYTFLHIELSLISYFLKVKTHQC